MEDDGDVSDTDKPSIQVVNNEDGNVLNVTNAEQCDSVHESGDSRFVDESQFSGELEAAFPKYDVSDVGGEAGDEEPAGDSQPAAESEHGSPKNDAGNVVKPKKDLQSIPEIEQCESFPEVDGSRVSDKSEPAVAEDGDDAEEVVEGKAMELEEPLNNEKCEPVPELDDVKHVGESESVARDDDDMVLEKYELRFAAKDGEDEDVPVVKKEEDTVVKKEVETSMALSEPTDSQLGHESEFAAGKEDKEGAILEEIEAYIEVVELDDSQLVGEAELFVAKEDENEDMVAEEQETPTSKEEEEEMVAEEREIHIATEDEDEDMVAEEQETPAAHTEMETVTELGRGGKKRKRKRGRNSKVTARVRVRKKAEEDVCFICFDGGDLVLCDRRGCPKAYHPSCVNRDDAFFHTKGRWNCGWHLCSICEKNAFYMCYTCTYSLCKSCIKDAVILCVRGNKGLCETCMKTVMLIERNELGKGEMAKVDFDDKSSWEYLFKDYWSDLKGKLLLSFDEVVQAKSHWKGSEALGDKQGYPVELYDANNEDGAGLDNPSGNKASTPRRRKAKKRIKPLTKEEDSASASDNSGNLDASKRRKAKKRSESSAERDSPSAVSAVIAKGTSMSDRSEWSSKEVLEFVMHMRDGDTSVLSHFDVQALLLEYIKRNELRDPRRKSQIICDLRLQNLFGKPSVGHFEMLKLLESHFHIREDSEADALQGTFDTETSQLDVDGSTDAPTKVGKDKKRKACRKDEEKALQSNVDDYAAIDTHNINLVYLRRNVMEALLEDSEYFYDKVVGSFVRIGIVGSNQKQEMYRLVQVVGTSKAAEPYKVVKRTTNIILEIQNLNKKDVISIDIISNQEFTEDECKRLHQSIKCGQINRLTLGDIKKKAMALQEVRVNDWLETEVVRLSHLRDCASETGCRKEYRECVEKLQRLKTPEERQRRLEEIPEVHSDPNMDPTYVSEEHEGEPDDRKHDYYMRLRGTDFSGRGREPISPRKGGSVSNDSGRGFSNQREDAAVTGDLANENTWTQERNRDRQQLNRCDRQKSVPISEIGARNSHSVVASESFAGVLSETLPPSLSVGVAHATAKFHETDKMWLYRDSSGKVHGPFSMGQLLKWSNTGYFPSDLRIWRSTENQDDSMLLTNALNGNFQKELPQMENTFSNAQSVHNPHLSSSHSGKLESAKGNSAVSVEVRRLGKNGWNFDKSDTSNLPSSNPGRSTAGDSGGQASEYNFSPNSFPAKKFSSVPKTPLGGQFTNLSMPPSASTSLSRSIDGSNASHATFTQQTNNEHNGIEYSGVMSSSVLRSIKQLTQGSENELPSLVDQSADTGGAGGGLPNSVQSGTPYNPSIESHGWSSGSFAIQKVEQCNQSPMLVQQPASSQWGTATSSSDHNFASSNPCGNLPVAGFSVSTDSWKPPVPVNQANMQHAAPLNLTWAMGNTETPNTAPTLGQEPITGWGPMLGNSKMGWGGPAQGNMNMDWGATAQGPAPGNANQGWVESGHGPAPGTVNPNCATPGQGPPHGNANPAWVAPTPGNTNQGRFPSGQEPPPGNANPTWVKPGNAFPGLVESSQGPPPGNVNSTWVAPGHVPAPGNASSGWIAPGQGPATGNSNLGWVPPNPNPGMWGSEQNLNGDGNQRERASEVGHSGSGGGSRAWNWRSLFGCVGQ